MLLRNDTVEMNHTEAEVKQHCCDADTTGDREFSNENDRHKISPVEKIATIIIGRGNEKYFDKMYLIKAT